MNFGKNILNNSKGKKDKKYNIKKILPKKFRIRK